MPSAIRQNQEMGPRGLVTILMECQGSDQQGLEAFLAERFPDNQAMACVNGQTSLPKSRGIPHAALVSIDGKLLWSGNPISGHSQIEELIEAELRRRAEGFGETEGEIAVRKLAYGREDYAAALEALKDIEDAQVQASMRAEVESVVERRFSGLSRQLETGRWIEAQRVSKALAKSVDGHEGWEARAKEIAERFKSKEGKAEIAAQKRFERTAAWIQENREDADKRALAQALEGLMDKVKGTAQEARVRSLSKSVGVTLD